MRKASFDLHPEDESDPADDIICALPDSATLASSKKTPTSEADVVDRFSFSLCTLLFRDKRCENLWNKWCLEASRSRLKGLAGGYLAYMIILLASTLLSGADVFIPGESGEPVTHEARAVATR
jgi:hypothetical protein